MGSITRQGEWVVPSNWVAPSARQVVCVIPLESRLVSGEFGLLCKQGSLWAWTEGARDDVLATIPDKHFEHAVMAAKERPSPE